jgi:hypothetical protein
MRIVIFILSTIIFSSCTYKHTINFDLSSIKSVDSSDIIDCNISIENFDDNRYNVPSNRIYLYGDHRFGDYCYNSAKSYLHDSVSTQVTQLIANHLRKRNSFKSVYVDVKDSTDFYITGRIDRIIGKQKAASYIPIYFFGLSGYLSLPTSECEVTIDIANIKIHKGNKIICKVPRVTKTYRGKYPADRWCIEVYNNVDECLNSSISDLCINIENEIKKHLTKNNP